MALIECRDCGKMFDPVVAKRHYSGGYYNQCASCAKGGGDAETKYLGRPGATNKGGDIEIFRSNLASVRQQLQHEGRIGFTANINLGNPATPSWEDIKDEHK